MSYSDDTAEFMFSGRPTMRELKPQMKDNHSCEGCGKTYKSTTKDRYCSMKCRYKARMNE